MTIQIEDRVVENIRFVHGKNSSLIREIADSTPPHMRTFRPFSKI
jgi:hypothetical protein